MGENAALFSLMFGAPSSVTSLEFDFVPLTTLPVPAPRSIGLPAL